MIIFLTNSFIINIIIIIISSFDIEPVSRFSPRNSPKRLQKRNEGSKFTNIKRNSTSQQNKNILAEQNARQIWTSFIETTWSSYVEK